MNMSALATHLAIFLRFFRVMTVLVKFLSLSNPLKPGSDNFIGRLSQPRGLNKDPTVWLDGARPPLGMFSNII